MRPKAERGALLGFQAGFSAVFWGKCCRFATKRDYWLKTTRYDYLGYRTRPKM